MKIYLKINQAEKTLNAFSSLGLAIADIEMEKNRLSKDVEILADRLTELKWKGRDEKIYLRKVVVCDDCTDPFMDYMCQPREVDAVL